MYPIACCELTLKVRSKKVRSELKKEFRSAYKHRRRTLDRTPRHVLIDKKSLMFFVVLSVLNKPTPIVFFASRKAWQVRRYALFRKYAVNPGYSFVFRFKPAGRGMRQAQIDSLISWVSIIR
jgi:hypothetical protein